MAVLSTMAGPLEAQDMNGAWTLTYSQAGRQGGQAREVSMDVTFQQDGSAITGTVLMAMPARGGPGGAGGGGGEPQEIPISDGKIEGNEFTFSIARGMGQRTLTLIYSGTVAGDAMEGTMAMTGGRMDRPPIPFKGVKKEG
jgi:hypothetical protein